jgi:hypothetical protein
MSSMNRILRRGAAVLAVMAAMGAVSVVTSSTEQGRVSAADVLGAGGEFHPLTPERVLDTRAGVNVAAGARPLVPGDGQSFVVPLSGMGGLPEMIDDDQVLAIAVAITVVEPTEPGYLRAFGTGEAEGTSSIVNFGPGETVPNMTILAPGDDGNITVRLVSESGSGSAHVLIDTFGWFSKGTYQENGSRLIPVGPGRIFDSRNPAFGATPIRPGQSVQVPIAGADSLNPAISGIVPDRDSITGVLVNVTGVNQRSTSAATFVSVVPERPADGVPPTTSNLNLRSNQVKANLVMVPVGADGSVWLYNSAGDVDLVVDVVAYLEPRPVDTREGRVIPLNQPFRVLDTRQEEFGPLRLGPGLADDWSFCRFAAGVTIGDDWVGPQSAFIGNLTATGLERPPEWFTPVDSFLTVYPSSNTDGEPPEASNLNIFENQSVPNAALFRFGEREREGGLIDRQSVRVYNYNGFVHYLVDAAAVVLTDDGADAAQLDCN